MKHNFYWSIVDLQCCISFRYTTKNPFIHISTVFQILFPYRPLQSIEQNFLCYTVGPCQLSVLYIVVCICQFSSVAQSCPTLCNPMDCSMPGLPVYHQFLEFIQLISIESVMSSNHLILCHPLLFPPSIFPSIRVFSNESVLRKSIEVSASTSVLPMNIQD